MKKIITVVFLVAIAAGNVWATELERVNLGTLPHIQAGVPVAGAPEKVKDNTSWAREAARELRKELKEQGISAKVSVGVTPAGAPFLLVEFSSREEYEEISDLFYQDPGAPSYMGINVVVMVPAAAPAIPSAKASSEITGDIGALIQGTPLLTTPVPKPVSSTVSSDNDSEQAIHVGDEVLVVFSFGRDLVGKVTKLFANDMALISYGWEYEQQVRSIKKGVYKSVKSIGGFSVGDIVIDANNYQGKVLKLFTNRQALISYGWEYREMYRNIETLSKQIR